MTGSQEQTKHRSSYIGLSGLAMGSLEFSLQRTPGYLQFIPSDNPYCWSLFYVINAMISYVIVHYVIAPFFF